MEKNTSCRYAGIPQRILSLVLCLCMVITLLPAMTTRAEAAKYATWILAGQAAQSGTDYVWDSGETVLTIYTAKGLAWFANETNGKNTGSDVRKNFSGKTVKLADNIDLDGVVDETNLTCVNSWIPISATNVNIFCGTFDGGGHIIDNMHISYGDESANNYSAWPSQQGAGLFNHLNAPGIITNVGIGSGSYIHNTGSEMPSYCVGGIVGYMNGGTIINCFNRAELSSEKGFALGGITGFIADKNAKVVNCYNVGRITAGSNVAGIAVYNYGTIINCYNYARLNITGTADSCRGISASSDVTGAMIASCYAFKASSSHSNASTISDIPGIDCQPSLAYDSINTSIITDYLNIFATKNINYYAFPLRSWEISNNEITFKKMAYNAVITAKKNDAVWTTAPAEQIVLSTSATDLSAGQKTATLSNGVYTFSGIALDATLYVWAKNNAGTYVNKGSVSSTSASADVNYYDVTLAKSTGVASVSGAGTYLSGENVSIDAVLDNGKIWSRWSNNTATPILDKKYQISAIDKSHTLTANVKTVPTLTIEANQGITFSNSAITTGNGSGDIQYSYNGDGKETVKLYADNNGTRGAVLASAPINSGTYWIGVSAPATLNCIAVAEVSERFTISKIPAHIITSNDFSYNLTSKNYNGNPQALTVLPKTGTANIVVKYNGSTTAPTLPGSYAITIDVSSATNYADKTGLSLGTYVINKLNVGSIVLTLTNPTATYEGEVEFKATVTGASGIATPTGTVTFGGYGSSKSVSLVNGVATLKKSDLSAVNYTITAAYNGDSIYNTKSAASQIQTVSKKAVHFTVNGLEQTYAANTPRTITIDKTGTALTAADFTVKYYKVDEDNGVLNSVTAVKNAVSTGKYLYVIDFKDSSALYSNYKITSKYTVSNTNLPTIANYDNIGYLYIKSSNEQQKPISFTSGLINKYVTDSAFINALTNENGTTPAYSSSNSSVATVDANGKVTIKSAGSTTITATSQKSGAPDVYASYTLNVSKKSVIVTVKDLSVTYGDSTPYMSKAQLIFSETVADADMSDIGLTFSGYTAGRNIGEYPISAKGLTSDKYAFSYDSGTLTVNPKPLVLGNFTAAAKDKIYDGTTTADVSAKVTSGTYASDSLGVEISGSFVDAAANTDIVVKYTITEITGTKAANYVLNDGTNTVNELSSETTATIGQATVSVVCQNTTVAYDNTEKTAAVSAYVDGKLFTDYRVTYQLGSAAATATKPSAVGTYTIGIDLLDKANYTVKPFTATLTIQDAVQDSFEITGIPDTVTYGDAPFALTAMGNTAGSVVSYAVTNTDAVTVTEDGNVTVVKPGTVTITATSKLTGYKDKTRTATFTVKKKSVTITAEAKAMTYGESFDTAVSNSYTVTGDVAGNEVTGTASYTTGYSAAKGAGTYAITPAGLTSEYYLFNYEPGILTVNKKHLTEGDFSVTVAGKEYDGTTAASFDVTVSAVAGDTLTAQYSGGFADATAADSVNAECVITGVSGAKAESYVLDSSPITKTASARISPMPIAFSFGTTTYLYDGQRKAVTVNAVDSKNRVFSDFTVNYKNDSYNDATPPTAVGEYTVTAELSDGTNYTVKSGTVNTATLNITEGNVVVWAAAGTTHKYDRSAKAITAMSVPSVVTDVTYYTIADDKVGAEIADPTDVGQYLYVITQSDLNYKIGNPVTVNVGDEVAGLSGSNFGIMEIAENIQPELNFAESLINKTYGDDAFTNALSGGEVDATVTYTSSDETVVTVDNAGQITILKPGTAVITATAAKEGFGNVSAKFAVQVAKRAVTLTVESETSVIYKGENWTIPYLLTGDVDGNKLNLADIDFNYTDNADPNKHTPRNVGTYLATAQVKSSNAYYTSGQATGLLKITPAPLTIIANPKTIIYGDVPANDGVTYTTLLGTDTAAELLGTLSFAYNYTQYDNMGSYVITPAGLTNDNYTITFADGTLTVSPKPVSLLWSTPDSFVYNAALQGITATVNDAVNEDTVTITGYTDNSKKDKGDYTATATGLSNTNYTLIGGNLLTKDWHITVATATLTLTNKMAVNTGSPIAIDAAKVAGVGTDADITAGYTVTYTYYTDAACTKQTTTTDGATTAGGAPANDGLYYVKAAIGAVGNYTQASAVASLTIYTPSNGGGGSSGGSTVVTPEISNPDVIGGNVTLNPAQPNKGDKVTVTVTPDAGYKNGGLTITDKDGKDITCIDNKDGTYSFIMPAGKITVSAKFAEMSNPFADVEKDVYYYDAVLWAVNKGITNGTSAAIFAPNTTCDRAQTVTFLWRAMGSPEPTTTNCPFTDVKSDAYYYKAVLWAIENGVTKGTGNTTFTPDALVTRGQTVTFLWRTADAAAAATSNPFVDVDDNAYYNDAVLWAAEQNITGGTSATTFSPANPCNRGQIVTFLYRYLG